MRWRINLYLVACALIAPVGWVILMTLSGMATFVQVIDAVLSIQIIVYVLFMMALLLIWVNQFFLPKVINCNERNDETAPRLMLNFPVVVLAWLIIYPTLGPVVAMIGKEWVEPLTYVLGIVVGTAATFVFAQPFYILALKTLENELGSIAFTNKKDYYYPLALRMGTGIIGLIVSALMTLCVIGIARLHHLGLVSGNVAETSQASVLFLIIAAILIVFSCFFIVIVMRTLSSVLVALSDQLKTSVQQEADLTVRLPVIAVDETGKTAHYFNQFLVRIEEVVKRVKDSSNKLVAYAGSLRKAAQDAGQLGQQSAATTEQIASGTESQARNLEAINIIMQDVNEATANLQGDVQKVLGDTANTAIQQVTASVREMTGAVENIGQATEVIASIADQTSLLALNAAIEAARAGEHGRGFAVVADEVGKLAENSASSVKEIDQLVTGIKNKAREVQQQLEASISILRKGNETTIGELERMIERFQEAAAKISDVAAAAQQAAAATEEFSAVAQEQSATMQEVAASAEGLLSLAESLDNDVKVFRC